MKAATAERVKTTWGEASGKAVHHPIQPSHVIEFLGPFPDLIRPAHARGVWLNDMSQTPEEGGHTIVRRGALAAQTRPSLPCCEGGDDRPPGDPRPCENSHWRLAHRRGDGTERCGTSNGGDKVGAGSTRAKAWSEEAQRERAGPQSLPRPSSTSPAAPDAPVSCHCGCF